MLTIEGPEAESMSKGFVETDKVKPCPFCGRKFLEPLHPVSPIVFHPGVITDDSCALSGMGFRERQFALLNRREPQVAFIRNPEKPDEVEEAPCND